MRVEKRAGGLSCHEKILAFESKVKDLDLKKIAFLLVESTNIKYLREIC